MYTTNSISKTTWLTEMTVGEKQTLISFNPIQDKWWNVWVWGGGKKAPYNFFFPVTSTNVGLGPKTF